LNRTLLIIDDEKSVRQSLRYLFNGKGYDIYEAGNAADGIKTAKDIQPDLAILDYRLPDRSGIDALPDIKTAAPDCLVIMLTAYGSIPDAVVAMKKGAFDYLTKPVDIDMLEIAVERAVGVRLLKQENDNLKSLRCSASEGIIGASTEVHRLLLMIGMLAENKDTTVLIEGESGTGKELAAKNIHDMSARSGKPFVDINCASLSENLLESELFGHEKGSFTDAKEAKKGLIEIADGGTLFLDEIGELSPSLQPKLLRVLETKTFRRVGGVKDIKVDVRFVAATNRDLTEAVAARQFREDLYYRLRVMPITIPPLRDRGGDVLILARHFVSLLSRGLKKKIEGISTECESFLLSYGWPGNVRELRNVMERAVILAPGPYIMPEHLARELTDSSTSGLKSRSAIPSLEEMEAKHIMAALTNTGNNHSEVARALGISRTTLLAKIKKYRLG
jgi:DNA-binding NtrC family response regulator